MTKFSDEADDYSLTYIRDTHAAYAFLHPEDEDQFVWLPKSQVEIDSRGALLTGRIYTVTVPNWLAEEKGLV